MLDRDVGTCEVEAETTLPSVSVQILNVELHAPVESLLHDAGAFRFDFATHPRGPTRARFADRWQADRFEAAGPLFLTPPGESMQIQSGRGVQRSVICRLSVERMEPLLGFGFEANDRSFEASLDICVPALRTLLSRLGQEVAAPGLATGIMVEALALQIGVELKRFLTGLEERREARGLAKWRLRLIEDRLERAGEPPSIAELSNLCGLSARQLARSFQASKGTSIGRFLIEHRILQAKQRLGRSETIKQVAHSVGFSSPSSFCSAFRRTTGLTPGEFRAGARTH